MPKALTCPLQYLIHRSYQAVGKENGLEELFEMLILYGVPGEIVAFIIACTTFLGYLYKRKTRPK